MFCKGYGKFLESVSLVKVYGLEILDRVVNLDGLVILVNLAILVNLVILVNPVVLVNLVTGYPS